MPRNAIVDMGIARLGDLTKIPNPERPVSYILHDSQLVMGRDFLWVVWIEKPDGSYCWEWIADQLVQQAALGEQWVFELAVEDCLHYRGYPAQIAV